MHHIISDATSMGIMEKEFMTIYEKSDLQPLRLQYKDYAEWQNRPGVKEKEKNKKQETYWLKQFKGEIPVLALPIDYPRPAVQGFEGSTISFAIDDKETQVLSMLALENEATMYMVLLSIYNILLSKLSGQEDIVTGTPVMGRSHADVHSIMGMFVNTLALRNYPQKQKTFEQLLQEVRKNALAAFENQDYPFEDLVEKLDVHRDMSRNPLFDVMFEVQNVERHAVEIPGLESLPIDFEYWISKFDIVIQSVEAGNKQAFIARYKTRLFKRETIERFIGYFKRLVSLVSHQPGIRLSDLDILSPREKQQVLFDFNDTAMAFPEEKTIHEIFREQAEKAPDHMALLGKSKKANDEPISITYKELNKKSAQLAYMLKEKGLQPGTIVGIMMERSLEMIFGILGILKAGGAYLPIDPGYPQERIDFMLKDSNAKILVSEVSKVSEVSEGIELIFIGKGMEYLTTFPFQQPRQTMVTPPAYHIRQTQHTSPTHLTHLTHPTHLSYIIYTSGSTGKPRGVLVGQRSLVNAAVWHGSYYDITQWDHVTQLASLGFDASVLEIFPALIRGAVLHIIAEQLKTDPWKLNQYYETRGITIGFLPTQLCEQFMELENHSLRALLTAGDKLRKFIKRSYQLYNNYGPTENTVAVTVFPVDKEYHNIPIGKPIYNNRIYILSIDFHLQPIGVIGELCITGDSLARGYLNNPELTAEKFCLRQPGGTLFEKTAPPGPPCKNFLLDGEWDHRSYMSYRSYIYRTGDLARWLMDGNIEFSGRIDRQVKVRGFRIEPGEIENRLIEINGISETVVIDKKDENGSTYLCAYIISQTGIDIPGIRGYLSKKIPDYMVPVYFVPIKTFPLTSSGKIDRSSLPEPEGLPLTSGIDYFAPRNIIEKKLVETWQHVLGRTGIGIYDDFFMLGGDSIKGIQVVSRMLKAGYKIEMKDLLQQPTIAELSPGVKKSQRIPEQSLITGIVPLTPVQEWLFNDSSTVPHHFNQAVLLDWQEYLEEEAVRAVFGKILEHHDALRISYKHQRGKIIQTNQGLDCPVSLQVYDLRQRADALSFLEDKANEIQASIDLETNPLMKLGLFHLDDGQRLLIVIHHLVVDGISWRILFEDIDHLFQQYKKGEPFNLPPKTDSFKYWSERQQEYADSENFLKEKTYWVELETRAAAVPAIKKDFAVEDNYLRDAETLSFHLNREQTLKLLTQVNQAFGTRIDDILLTALGLAVKENWGNDCLLVEMEGHGREEILHDMDISRTVGWFTSIYPVLLDISYDGDTARQLKEIKETLRRVPHKGIGYGILKYLTAPKHKKNMLFNLEPQLSFNYLGQFDDDVKQGPFRAANESAGQTQSPERKREHQINISGIITDNRLVMSVTFNRQQFKRETINAFCKHYQTRLVDLISFCASRETRSLTPADLTYSGLSIEALDRLTSQYALEDIYHLTPMQEGMRFHTVVNRDSTAYFEQIFYRLQGELHVTLVEKSLQQLFKRHDVLRTVFIDVEDSDRALQVVLKDRQIDFLYEDIRKIQALKDREKYVNEFKENERKRSFDLSKDTLMRAAIFRVEDKTYEFTWSFHHILMDGWCIGILNSEFFEIYTGLLEKRGVRLPEAKPLGLPGLL
jgi:bacitracin synthase 3